MSHAKHRRHPVHHVGYHPRVLLEMAREANRQIETHTRRRGRRQLYASVREAFAATRR